MEPRTDNFDALWSKLKERVKEARTHEELDQITTTVCVLLEEKTSPQTQAQQQN